MLVQIEAKSVWIECFHSFTAAVAEYLKKRATLPVTSISLAVRQAVTRFCCVLLDQHFLIGQPKQFHNKTTVQCGIPNVFAT